jgi:aspartate/tyrosine/aromatic aminotransferase
VDGARKLLFGAESEVIKSQRVASTQTLSGTGALGVAFDFIAKYLPRTVYISSPTWPIHRGIIEKNHLRCLEYPYYSAKLKGIDFEAMLKGLAAAVPGSYVVLHPSAHNPTGFDLTEQQWRRVAELMKRNSLIPFFDTAYQGFATGDFAKDAWAVRHFVEEGFQLFVAQSFAKNMGLYGERVGGLHVVLNSTETAERVLSQIKYFLPHAETSSA